MRTRITTIIQTWLLLSGLAPLYAQEFSRSERLQLPDISLPAPPPQVQTSIPVAPSLTGSTTTDYDYNNAAKQQFKRVFDSVYEALGEQDIPASQQTFASTRHLTDGHVVSIDFIEANIREAFQELSNQTHIPFILEDAVQGFVTLKQEKAPLKKAMEMMLVAGGYRYKEMDGYILIGAAESANPAFDDNKQTEVVTPAFLKPSEILALLSEKYTKLVKANDDNSTLAITADPVVLQRIVADIRQIDQQPEQIMLEVLVVDISKTAKSRMGIDWWSSNSGILASPLNQEALGFEGTEGSFNLLSPLNMLSLRIESLVDIGEAKIWAAPKVLTSNGKKANIAVKSIETFPIVSGPQK